MHPSRLRLYYRRSVSKKLLIMLLSVIATASVDVKASSHTVNQNYAYKAVFNARVENESQDDIYFTKR